MEKIKITMKELTDMYDIDDSNIEIVPEKKEDNSANATFEVYTQEYDEKQMKEMKEENG